MLAIAATAVLVVTGCLPGLAAAPSPVAGAGDPVSENRTTGEFTGVSAGAGINVVVAVGPSTRVTVTAQPNLLPLVTTKVTNGRLVADIVSPGVSSTRPVTVRVTAPSITSVALGSGATGTMELTADRVALDLSGGATIQAIGTVKQLSLTASGGATAQLGSLAATLCTVAVGGGSKSTLHVTTELTGTADGGATITLVAKPTAQSVTLSGGATITGP